MTDEGTTGNKRTIIIGVAILIFLGVALLQWTQREKYKPVVKGVPAPEFVLPDLQGNQVSLSSFKGKVVFLNFWATWCEPCKEEMPSMESLNRYLKDREFVMLAVSIDKDPSKIESFMKELNLTMNVLLDKDSKIFQRYKTTGVPETFIIDKNGIIAEKIVGPRDWTRPENLRTIETVLGT